ncbi:MAG: hypothetical protein JRI87_03245 [Deltaproteobacteria bacterium]|nr:hypothetical protein [Deltaproteobacteria bacterium]
MKGREAGIISPVSHSLCHNCNRLNLTSDGYFKTCLVHKVQVDLTAPLSIKK